MSRVFKFGVGHVLVYCEYNNKNLSAKLKIIFNRKIGIHFIKAIQKDTPSVYSHSCIVEYYKTAAITIKPFRNYLFRCASKAISSGQKRLACFPLPFFRSLTASI